MKKTEDTKKLVTRESVSTRILTSFIDVLAQEKELKEVSDRLRDAMIEKRQFSESALREALFEKRI